MNTIRQVPTRVKSRRVEANLGAEREHFDKQQVKTLLGGRRQAVLRATAAADVRGGNRAPPGPRLQLTD